MKHFCSTGTKLGGKRHRYRLASEDVIVGQRRKYRQGTNTPMRRWEAPFVEAFGTEWVQCAVAAAGVRWHETRWDFARAILQGSQIGVTSLPEAMRELRLAKDRAPSPRQNAAGASRTGLVTATQERQARTARERAADAIWKEVWTVSPDCHRSQRRGEGGGVRSVGG